METGDSGSNRLAKLCKHKRIALSQEKFGARMGKSRNGAAAWFRRNGKNSVPEVTVLLTLARDFDVNVNWLLLGKGQPFRRKVQASPKKPKPSVTRLQSDAVVLSEKPSVLPQSDPAAKKNP
jgi:transcriptional regulator with XRE-family HTH domain